VLNVDSPGGAVTGISALADQIFASRSIKPIDAF
jgi:ClpP class serine protease